MPSDQAVVLTQELADCERLAARLNEHGISSTNYPCIATRIIPYSGEELPGRRTLEEFKVVAFTSKRGVAGMLNLRQRLLDLKPLVACVGNTTAHEVKEQLGMDCSILPKEQTAKGLAQAVIEHFPEPSAVLHFRGNKSSGEFKATLEHHGWEVCEMVVYENYAPEITALAIDSDALVVFASPSAAKRFFETNPGLKISLTCIAIGSTTARCLRTLDVAHIVKSAQSTHESLVDTILMKLTQGTKA